MNKSPQFSKYLWTNPIWADNGLSTKQKALLQVIANHADKYGFGAFPSYETLMVKASIGNRRTVSAALKELCERGFLIKNRRYGKSTRYEVCTAELSGVKSDTNSSTKSATLTDPLTDTTSKPKQSMTPERYRYLHDKEVEKANMILAKAQYYKDRAESLEMERDDEV